MFKSDLLLSLNKVDVYGNISPEIFYDAVTDSREDVAGKVFFALKGDNFDANKFVLDVLDRQAAGIVCDEKGLLSRIDRSSLINNKQFVILVDNVLDFLQNLSKLHLLSWKKNGGNIICITGSNGKTTTKEIISELALSILSHEQVLKTEGNFNNHIGVPLTLLKINKNHKLGIIEIGTNHPGEIAFLSSLAMPDFGFITNIGQSHLEFFKNEEGVFVEKRELHEYIVKNQGVFFRNVNDKYLSKIKNGNCIDIGNVKGNGAIIVDEQDCTVCIWWENREYKIKNSNLIGEHNLFNLGAAIQILLNVLKIPNVEKVLLAAENFSPRNKRSVWIDKGNQKIFFDAYNANPSSMRAAIAAFDRYLKKNRIDLKQALVIIGDMNELGENADSMHQEIGQYLSDLNFQNVVVIGRFSRAYLKGFNHVAICAESVEEFLSNHRQILQKYSYYFVKASRSLQLESLLKIW